jgi:putative flippase GtrA
MIISLVSFILDALVHPKNDSSLKAQAVRQILAGAFTTVLDLLSFKLCLIFGIHPMVAAVISFCVGVLSNFILTRVYVIGDVAKQKKKPQFQLAIYVAACLVSLGIVQVFLLIFHFHFKLDPFVVKIMAVPVVFIWTVLASRYIVFDKK